MFYCVANNGYAEKKAGYTIRCLANAECRRKSFFAIRLLCCYGAAAFKRVFATGDFVLHRGLPACLAGNEQLATEL